jgi:hypothetical protein
MPDLLLDRPPNGRIGKSFMIEALQWDDKREELIGGITMRVELMPEPETQKYFLQLWKNNWDSRADIRVRLFDEAGQLVSPENGAEVHLSLQSANNHGERLVMKWHRSWKAFYYYPARFNSSFMQIKATALINGRKVAQEELNFLPTSVKHVL